MDFSLMKQEQSDMPLIRKHSALSMSLPPELSQWLSNVLQQHYPHSDAAFPHVAQTLLRNSTLKPRTRVHTNEHGIPNLLLNLYGSLPAFISNRRYNIPVEIWIPLQFPLEPPMCYVTPTEKMLLNPGNHVDANGRCYLSYLANWDIQVSKLDQLCVELSNVFAIQPPVYAKPKQMSTSSVSPSPQPALPPKQTPNKLNPHNLYSPPPIPPIPQSIRSQISPEFRPPATIPPQSPTPISTEQPNFMDSQPNATTSPQTDHERDQILHHLNQILASLQKNVILPNLNQFKQNTSQIQQSISQFSKIFEFENSQLDNINQTIINNKAILESTIKSAESTISTIQASEKPDPDLIITTSSIPHAQLYELVSQDMAINDTLSALNSAFSQGKISFSSLLKYSRQLSREQFEKRALVRKIAGELALDV